MHGLILPLFFAFAIGIMFVLEYINYCAVLYDFLIVLYGYLWFLVIIFSSVFVLSYDLPSHILLLVSLFLISCLITFFFLT